MVRVIRPRPSGASVPPVLPQQAAPRPLARRGIARSCVAVVWWPIGLLLKAVRRLWRVAICALLVAAVAFPAMRWILPDRIALAAKAREEFNVAHSRLRDVSAQYAGILEPLSPFVQPGIAEDQHAAFAGCATAIRAVITREREQREAIEDVMDDYLVAVDRAARAFRAAETAYERLGRRSPTPLSTTCATLAQHSQREAEAMEYHGQAVRQQWNAVKDKLKTFASLERFLEEVERCEQTYPIVMREARSHGAIPFSDEFRICLGHCRELCGQVEAMRGVVETGPSLQQNRQNGNQ